jgi:hypothetical protein
MIIFIIIHFIHLHKHKYSNSSTIIVSRPDIAFSMGVCDRFQYNHKESLLTTIKRILKYLSAIIDYGLWYSKDSNLSLVSYLDVN